MKKVLLKKLGIIMLLLVTLFSYSIKSNAANFKYKDFDWDEFSKQNKNAWIDSCDEEDEECIDKVLATKKRFYIRLYELLAAVPTSYGYIDDNYIIATVFYGLDPDSFRDPNSDENNPYNLDAEDSPDKNKYIADVNEAEIEAAKEYFKKETDTLKTLVNSFIGYEITCIADNGTMATQFTDENGNTGWTCPDEQYKLVNEKCYPKLETFKGNFFDSIGLESLGNNIKTKCKELCEEKGMTFYDVQTSNNKRVNNDFFFDFLENTDYFDNKSHLRNEFKSVLEKSNYPTMKEFYNKASDEEKEKFKEEIIKCRKSIVTKIKNIIKEYGEENLSKLSNNFNNVNSNTYWWPIGSDETSESNGVLFATGAPSNITITSQFGLRTHPVTGEKSKKHNGIDIGGSLGLTNVIASKDGVVSTVVNNCPDGTNQSCGGGFGNFVIIQHMDNNYTIYAHMASGSITVNIGDSVKQGQVIGKVGNSGRSTGAHLHFEVRVGGNDSSLVQDPLAFVSIENPRSASGDIIIPEEYGNAGFFTYTVITQFNWVYNQKKVYDAWINSGSQVDNYVATIDGRYLIACTTTYGEIGDMIDFYLEDGTKIETIMFDAKAQTVEAWDPNPANKWGHHDGQQILEFEIVSSPNGSGDVGSWMGWTGKRVASATNLGQNIIN